MLGTAVQVTFVASVDGRRIGPLEEVAVGTQSSPGPICRLLREKFSTILAVLTLSQINGSQNLR